MKDHAGDEGGDVFGKVKAHDDILVHPRHRHPNEGQHRRQDHGPLQCTSRMVRPWRCGQATSTPGCPGQKPEDPACRRGAVKVFFQKAPVMEPVMGLNLKSVSVGQHREKREEEHQERKARTCPLSRLLRAEIMATITVMAASMNFMPGKLRPMKRATVFMPVQSEWTCPGPWRAWRRACRFSNP